MSGPVRVFLSYAHEDAAWRDKVLKHLGWLRNTNQLAVFDDRQIKPGAQWDVTIKEQLESASIIIVLISPDFVNSRYCGVVELLSALKRVESGSARLVAIVCDHVALSTLSVAKHQCLPQDERNDLKPLVDWPNPNVPLAAVAEKISAMLAEIEAERARTVASGAPPPPEAGAGVWKQPAPPTRCFGRAAETERLVRALVAEPPCAAVVFGGPGMGKTTLTLEAACHPEVVGRFGERRCVVPLDQAAGPEALVAVVLEALGLQQGGEPWRAIEAALRPAAALVVLDNLETPWQADERGTEEQLARLAGIPGVRLLASIRSGGPPAKPRWGVRFEVDRLL